jgi:diguanylate cyclase (GGDEF)-like protein
VSTELVLAIVTAIVGGLLALGAGLALLQERGERGALPVPVAEPPPNEPAGKYDVGAEFSAAGSPDSRTSTAAVVRILWWVTVAGVLIGIGLSGQYGENRTPIYAVGGLAVVAILVLHELLPARWRTTFLCWLEVLVAFALTGSLLLLTGYGASPFAFILDLIAVVVALAAREWAAVGATLGASAIYVGVIAADPAATQLTNAFLLQVALSVGALWLLTFLAAVFARNQRRVRAMLSRLSRIDALTGLLNRGQIYPTLEQEVRRTRRSERSFSLLMIDLDGLKTVNDSLGHQRGDDVLRELGRIIRDDTRTVDSAYRYGGDEFVVLLPETDYPGAYVVAEKIRADAEELGLRLEAEGVSASVSVGLVSHPEDGSTAEDLIRAADRAMYNAKALGKNQISGYPRPFRTPPLADLGPREDASPRGDGPVPRGPAPRPVPGGGATDVPPAPVSFSEASVDELPPVVAVTDEWVRVPEPELQVIPVAAGHGETAGDEEPDAAEIRRSFAVASRSFDPDHHVLRAMDALLSPRERPVRRPD